MSSKFVYPRMFVMYRYDSFKSLLSSKINAIKIRNLLEVKVCAAQVFIFPFKTWYSIRLVAKTNLNGAMRWPNFHGQKNLLNLEINYGSEKAKREPTQV